MVPYGVLRTSSIQLSFWARVRLPRPSYHSSTVTGQTAALNFWMPKKDEPSSGFLSGQCLQVYQQVYHRYDVDFDMTTDVLCPRYKQSLPGR